MPNATFSTHGTTGRVLDAWLSRRADYGTESFHTDGHKLLSYRTCLLEWAPDGALLMNVTTYSKTTSAKQRAVGRMIAAHRVVGWTVRTYGAVPQGAGSLVDYERRAAHCAALGMTDPEAEANRRGVPSGSPVAARAVADRLQAATVAHVHAGGASA